MHPFCAISICILFYGCQSPGPFDNVTAADTASLATLIADTFVVNDIALADTTPSYSNLVFEKREVLLSAPGTKSVLFNSKATKLYALNLEGMSVYEFEQRTRHVLREFRFRPTKGMGWDYEGDSAIFSYQEKPVEACFTGRDKILWVSLHNAGGIVPIMVDSFPFNRRSTDSTPIEHITVIYPDREQTDSFDAPLIKTGRIPKVIAKTSDDKNLLVSNWQSYTVSILAVDQSQYPYAKVIRTIPLQAIPRGIAVDDKNNKSYVAIMGGSTITILNNWVWQKEDELQVASNPRHILLDTTGRLFVSFNKLSQIACVNAETGKTLFTASTHPQPRTIALSKNKRFLFVTCYNGNTVDVFKIFNDHFRILYSIPCKGKPVGVDIYEDDQKLEAWVCTYTNGAINVLSFRKTHRP